MLDSLFTRHLFHAVHNEQVQGVRNESGTNPLNLVGPGLELFSLEALRDDRTLSRFHGHTDNLFLLFSFDELRYARNGPSRANSGDEHIDRTLRLFPDLRTCGLEMNLGICRILELLRHKILP